MESYIIKLSTEYGIRPGHGFLELETEERRRRIGAADRLMARMRKGTMQIVKVALKPMQFSS